jgi:hypothetical protein
MLMSFRIAHNLADGDIPLEHVRYDLTDLIVVSLRASQKHRSLACNWSAMLHILESDSSITSEECDDDLPRAERRMDVVKQRVLLRLLVCAAEMEVSALSGDGGIAQNMDPDLVEARKSAQENVVPRKKQKTNSTHEELTLALLSALPSLVTSYKTESAVLQSLTGLPQYFCKLFMFVITSSPMTCFLTDVLHYAF